MMTWVVWPSCGSLLAMSARKSAWLATTQVRFLGPANACFSEVTRVLGVVLFRLEEWASRAVVGGYESPREHLVRRHVDFYPVSVVGVPIVYSFDQLFCWSPAFAGVLVAECFVAVAAQVVVLALEDGVLELSGFDDAGFLEGLDEFRGYPFLPAVAGG